MNNNKNMICDLETGVCGEATEEETGLIDFNQPKKTVDIYYVTDPICSHCWAQEPVFRRFIKQYAHYFNFHTVMGGLLEKWHDGPIDPGNGIYKPADVAGHWREVGEHTRMPIDGSLMVNDPVESSFPASRVFKVIQKNYSDTKATEYLRRAREALFVYNKNISNDSTLIELVNNIDLDGEEIINEANQPHTQSLLNEDFELTRNLGARGFPSIIMINEDNKSAKNVSSRTLKNYDEGKKQVLNQEKLETKQQPTLSSLFEEKILLFSREIEEMYNLEQSNVSAFVEKELQADTYQTNEFLGETYFTHSK